MTFDDGGEVDDKVIAVLADDKRVDHIKSFEDLKITGRRKPPTGSTKTSKPGTCTVNGFSDDKPIEIIKSCEARYLKEIDPKFLIERRLPLVHVHQNTSLASGLWVPRWALAGRRSPCLQQGNRRPWCRPAGCTRRCRCRVVH